LAVQTIDLAYVERGVHELLVASVADQEGYYEDEGVHVAIHNGIGWDPERLRRGASIGLGRALLQRLTGGIEWKVLSVNTDRPLFWFIGNADVTSMADLRGRRVAVHPPQTAPGWFTRIALRKNGLDPDRDLERIARLPVNYQMDLRGLRDGSIDAACVGTTFSPEQVAEEEGFHVLGWVGDYIQIPTVGVAVDPVHIPLDSPALQALVRANNRALQTIAEQHQPGRRLHRLVPRPAHARRSAAVLRTLHRPVLHPRRTGRPRHRAARDRRGRGRTRTHPNSRARDLSAAPVSRRSP
jgi:ABC-type nitrate/sulfonate/bicarbonate transport system substrate-binding protein